MNWLSHTLQMRRRFAVGDRSALCIEERWISSGVQEDKSDSWFEMRYIEIPMDFLNLSDEDQVAIFPRALKVDPIIFKILRENDAVYLIGKMVGKRKIAEKLAYIYHARGDEKSDPFLEAVLEAYKRRYQHRNVLHFAKVAGIFTSKFLEHGFRKLEGSGLLVAGRPGRRRWEKVDVSFRF